MNHVINKNVQYKCLPFLVTLMTTISLCIHFFSMEGMWPGNMCFSYVFYPILFLMADVIVEVYGYKLGMKLFWYYFFVKIAFYLTCCAIILLSSLVYDTRQAFFNYVFKDLWGEFFVSPIFLFLAWKINVKLILKLKIIFKSKCFWVRSFFCSAISEIVFFAAMAAKGLFDYSFNEVFEHGYVILLYRILATFLLAYPGAVLMDLIKIIEQQNTVFLANPFLKKNSTRYD